MATAYIGLGANTGNREANLRMALSGLTRMARVEAVSSLYETAPVGSEEEQPAFYNAVCLIETGLEPESLLRFLPVACFEQDAQVIAGAGQVASILRPLGLAAEPLLQLFLGCQRFASAITSHPRQKPTSRRGAGVAEQGCLLSSYTGQNPYRGFESLPLRHFTS